MNDPLVSFASPLCFLSTLIYDGNWYLLRASVRFHIFVMNTIHKVYFFISDSDTLQAVIPLSSPELTWGEIVAIVLGIIFFLLLLSVCGLLQGKEILCTYFLK